MYLTCELSKDKEVVWKKNGKELKSIPGKITINVIGLQQGITIQDSNDDDAGVYTCECENIKTQTNVKIIGTMFYLTKPLHLTIVNAETVLNVCMYVFNRNR